MTAPRQRVTVAAATILVFALALQAVLLRRLDSLRDRSAMREMLYISSSKVLRRLSLGFNGLMGDIYWTRVVQYYGAKRELDSTDFELLYPLLDITTDLDPHLIVAYEAGSIFLSQQQPIGAQRPDLAIKLLEKGVRENPSQWHLYFTMGFVEYIDRRDPAAAAQDLLRGAAIPGAKSWMKTTAAAMMSNAGQTNTARALWREMYTSSGNADVRLTALGHLEALDIDELVPKLEERVNDFRRATGHYPASWGEMVRAGYLRGIPLDPKGTPYKLTSYGTVELENPNDFPYALEGLPPGTIRPHL